MRRGREQLDKRKSTRRQNKEMILTGHNQDWSDCKTITGLTQETDTLSDLSVV